MSETHDDAFDPQALRQELLELHFGCHPDPAALEQRLTADSRLRELQQQVLAEAMLLETAARLPVPELQLPNLRRPRSRWSPRSWLPLRLQVAAAALLLGAVGVSVPWGLASWQRHRVHGAQPVLTWTAPPQVAPGVPWSLGVDSRDANGEPVAATVGWRLLAADGRQLAAGEGAVTGAGALAMAPQLEVPRRLELVGSVLGQRHEHAFVLEPLAVMPIVHLDTDQPVVRPEETARLRVVALDRVSLQPDTALLRLDVQLLDPRGSPVFTGVCEKLEHGVHTASWALPAGLPGGRYVWQVRHQGAQLAELPVLVADFQPSQLRSQIALDRRVYRPGQQARVAIVSERLTGGAVAGGEVVGEVVIDGESVWRQTARLDAQGSVEFSFPVPAKVARGEGRFVATVGDGAVREAEVATFSVPNGQLRGRLLAEGGSLVAGIEGRVYVEVQDDLGRGVRTQGLVVDDRGTRLGEVSTDAAGRGLIAFAPVAGRRYELLLPQHDNQRFPGPAVVASGAGLRIVDSVVANGAPLRLQVQSRDPGPWVAAVFARGALLAQQPILAAGVAEIALPASAMGVLQVTLFDRLLVPVAERLVLRQGQRVQIDLAMAPQVLPGGDQAITVTTRDAGGNPMAAAVGLSVFDQARELLQLRPWRGLVDDAELFADLPGDDEPARFAGAERERAIDLWLGTAGWRQLVPADGKRPVPAHAERVAELPPQTWQLPVAPAVAESAQAAHRAARTAGTGYGLILLLGLAVLVAELGIRLARWGGGRGVASDIAAAIAAVASLALVLFVVVGREVAVLGELAPAADRFFDRNDEFITGRWDVWAASGVVPASGADRDVYRLMVLGRVDTLSSAPFPGQEAVADPQSHLRLATSPSQHFPLIVTDAAGRATVRFNAGSRVTGWRVRASAHANAALGQRQAAFATILPFAIEARMPVAACVGDELEIPVSVRGPRAATLAMLQVETRGDVLLTQPTLRVDLVDGRGRGFVPLRMVGAGPVRLQVRGRCGEHDDAIAQEFVVVPAGFPHTASAAGVLADRHDLDLEIPADALSPTAKLRFFASPLTQIADALAGMVQEPHGCFEQTSSTNYPNTLVLTLLERGGDALPVAPAVAERARGMLERGLARLLSFECRSGGFDWFGRDPGHVALTAYGLLQFADMAAVVDVDTAMLTRTRDWLLARRDGNGGFTADAAGHAFGMAAAGVVDSYVLLALLQGGAPVADLGRELDAASTRSQTIGDPYELAVTACALAAGERAAPAAAARRRLRAMRQADGSMSEAASGIVGSRGKDLAVETAAWAALAFLQHPDHAGDAAAAIQWLLTQRQGNGAFGATQATVMALKAIVADLQVRQATSTKGRVLVHVGDRQVGEVPLHRDASAPLEFELGPHVQPGHNRVRLQLLDGDGAVPFALAVEYRSLRPADDADGAITVAAAFGAAQVDEGAAVPLQVRIANRTAQAQAMPMAIVGLPAGVELRATELDELVRAQAIAAWELRGQELVCYLRGLQAHEERQLQLTAIGAVPGRAQGPASRGYLYYTPGKRWAEPLQLTVRARR